MKKQETRFPEFVKQDLNTRISRWLGMLLISIGEGKVRDTLYNIWDEVNDIAYARGYNQAIDDMGKQPTLPGTK